MDSKMKGNRKKRAYSCREEREWLGYKEAPDPLSEHYTFFSPTTYLHYIPFVQLHYAHQYTFITPWVDHDLMH